MPINDAIISLLSHEAKFKTTCTYSNNEKSIILRALIIHINMGLPIGSIQLKKGSTKNIPANVKRKLAKKFGAVPFNNVIY